MQFKTKAENTDKIILDSIYLNLIKCFDECSLNITNSYQNLCGLIFHELIIFYSSMYYSKIWRYDLNDSNHIFNNYPYLGYRKHKITDPFKIKYASNKMKFYYSINNIFTNNTKKIGVCHPSLNHRQLMQQLFSNGYVPKFPSKPKIYIENYKEQYQLINQWMARIEQELKLPRKSKKFTNAMKESFSGLLSKKEIIPDYDCLIIGTPGKFLSRVEAANALRHNIPVVCVAHGNESGTADHPSWGYDDRSFCTHYLGYGRAGNININGGKYLDSIYGFEPEYIESSSEFINNNFDTDSENEIRNVNIAEGRYAYIPIKQMGCNRLGPFLSISDNDYIKWQKSILEIFPALFFKAHPKNTAEVPVEHERIVFDSLEECLHDFHGFVIDTVLSTAFANIALTNKPIIYLNIGFGKLTPYAEKLIRQRVIWIDVDFNNLQDIHKKVETVMCKPKVNKYTPEFSLTSNNDSRIDTLINTLDTIFIHK